MLHHGFQSQPLLGAMRSNLRIHKLLNPALIHPHGVFDMINVLFRNARHHVQIFISTIRPLPPPSFMVSCNAASKTNGCSSHFSTLFSYYPPTHTRNSFCPRTSVRQSVSEHRMCKLSGRKARPNLSSLLSRRFRMHQGGRHAIVLRITLSINLPVTSHALGIIHSASVAIRLHACVRISHDARRTGSHLLAK